ncbi:hypothetical protein RF11_01046 [Thelohanellus kitauei]|uniref:Uncharacterized protein n=1 Tax=Thelohanellus kitauei TaxID=669202 RepID=A0A0C2MYE4_THEKT|nr:hypothetical protein RF11_01046 [Thelohanellus kitauei]
MSRIFHHGYKIGKANIVQVYLHMSADMDSSITLDYSWEIMYNFKENYITKSSFLGASSSKIYYFYETVIDMEFEAVSRNLIYLNDRKRLLILSLTTNFYFMVSKDVIWFKYASNQR